MPKYLTLGSYTTEGVKGLLKEGAAKRIVALEEAAKSLGGSRLIPSETLINRSNDDLGGVRQLAVVKAAAGHTRVSWHTSQ